MAALNRFPEKMKKILFINPPRQQFSKYNQFVITLPLGILGIASYLRTKNIDVEIIDCLVDDFEIIQYPTHERWGMSLDNLASRIKATDFDLVGVTFPFTSQESVCLEIIRLIKKMYPETPIITGGPHVTVAYEDLLRNHPEIDICVLQEGEITARALIENYDPDLKKFSSLAGIDGIAFRDSRRQIVKTNRRPFISDLDELPYPAYDLVPLEKYLLNNYSYFRPPGLENSRRINMITSRGCPHQCLFCSVHASMGRKWRAHSAEYVMKHILYVINTFGVQYIHFEDDNLSFNVARFDAIMDLIEKSKISLHWDDNNGMRADNWTYDRLRRAKKCGLELMTLPIESGSQYVLDHVIRKRLKLEDVRQTVAMCHEIGIPMAAFFVVGLPGETLTEMKKSFQFAIDLYKQYSVDCYIMVAIPFLGTKLHQICIENNYISNKIPSHDLVNGIIHNTDSLISTNDFSPADIRDLFLWYRRRLIFLSIRKYLRNPLMLMKKITSKL